MTDLGIIQPNQKSSDLIRFYDRTKTPGGHAQLNKQLLNPVSDRDLLENRKAEIRFFLQSTIRLQLNSKPFTFTAYYLNNKHIPLKNNFIDAFRDSIVNKLKATNDYYIIREGILFLLQILKDLRIFLHQISEYDPPESLQSIFDEAREYLKSIPVSHLLDNPPKTSKKLKAGQINTLDHFFRSRLKKTKLLAVLEHIYKIDVL